MISPDAESHQPTRTVGRRRRLVRWLYRNLNFYRLHLLGFIVTPLIFSIIFYFSNGKYHISYVDSLFLCVTSMTVCGLATVNLSTLTGFQQALMYILMWIGHPVTISIIIIQSRMWIFEEHLEPLVRKRREEREARRRRNSMNQAWPQRVFSIFGPTASSGTTKRSSVPVVETVESDEGSNRRRLKIGMIRRMSNAPQRINPSGHVMEFRPEAPASANKNDYVTNSAPVLSESPSLLPSDQPADPPPAIAVRQATGDETHSALEITSSPLLDQTEPASLLNPRRATREGQETSGLIDNRGTSTAIPRIQTMPRTQTVEFALARPTRTRSPERGGRTDFPTYQSSDVREVDAQRNSTTFQEHPYQGLERYPSRPNLFPRTATGISIKRHGSMHTGFGGFPTPYRLLIKLISWIAPAMAERIRLRLTVPRTQSMKLKPTKSIASQTIEAAIQTEKRMISEDLEFLGGVEYKSLKLLRLIVISYHVGIQLIGAALIIGDATRKKWLSIFQAQPRFIRPAWFAVFQVTSAYSNTGTSLADQSIIPFQTAYLMIVTMIILILAGNTAFPIFLRLFIWILKKCNSANAPIQEPLHFLLKHPRRCYIYLFPSHQTWFLLTMIVTLTMTDWICFLVLDIGNPVTDSIPVGTRMLIGVLQACAVRAAGFGTVSLSALAPAVKVLYVIMMYVSVYPIAMSVRSTNVYEEKSLGIFEEDVPSSESSSIRSQEEKFGQRIGESRRKVWGEYLLFHAKQQLAFDMWWLGLALWLICIIERGPLMNPDNQSWFTIFTVMFEVVSAYGTVGMSLGVPYDNFSTSGAFSTLAKLIVCAVMIRGRHRGLPVAIDRAIVLPNEYNKKKNDLGDTAYPKLETEIALSDANHTSSANDRNPPLQNPRNGMHLGTVLESSPALDSPNPHGLPFNPSTASFLSSGDAHE